MKSNQSSTPLQTKKKISSRNNYQNSVSFIDIIFCLVYVMILNCVLLLPVFLCLCDSVSLPLFIEFEGAMALEDNLGVGLNFHLV